MWAITLPTRIKKALKSIRFKFILAYLLIIVFAFAALGVASVQPVGEYLYTNLKDECAGAVNRVSRRLSAALETGDYLSAYNIIAESAEEYSARIVVLDASGTVAIDSLSLLNGTSPNLSKATSAIAGDKSELYKRVDAGDMAAQFSSKRVIVASNVLANGFRTVGAFDADQVLSALNQIYKKLVIAAAAVLVVAVLLGFMITRSYTRPVKELSSAITKLSAGDFSVRVKEEGNNELTDLSRAFNEMTGRMEMLDRSRNQFVSNASHELKTPLATIKIMVQTLLYQEVYDETMSKEFLGDVDREVDRLSAVVSDLLTLVGMDSGESKLNMEELSVSDMVTEDVKRLSPLARERGVELEMGSVQSIDVYGDRIKLDQVFYNLIDNAIKYTPRGLGVKVEVLKQNKNAVIRVKDNGIGIPEEDQKHIFDRFYRVDKARSRETGGTGLGLSIVKQIILAHGGTISVASKPDQGSVFTVTLPIGKPAGRQNQ